MGFFLPFFPIFRSQTKDPVTAAAMSNLHAHFLSSGGVTVDNIIKVAPITLNSLICKVGFHNRKTEYIQKTAQILKDQYKGDIPDTIEGLTALPGVGPKMGYLALSCAWNRVEGIGVDVHVHRISNRLGWVKSKEPEQTREALQEWLPRELWTVINHLLVGFGQQICLPINPRCSDCKVNHLCAEGKKVVRKINGTPAKSKVKAETVKVEHEISIKKEEEEENNGEREESMSGQLSAAGNAKIASLNQFIFKAPNNLKSPLKQEESNQSISVKDSPGYTARSTKRSNSQVDSAERSPATRARRK
jgi:endonuclease-3